MAQRNRSVSLKPAKSRTALTITHPNAAGIDIGNAAHYVAVPPDRDDEPVREFPSFTVDLNAIADWLKVCGVDIPIPPPVYLTSWASWSVTLERSCLTARTPARWAMPKLALRRFLRWPARYRNVPCSLLLFGCNL